jgi:hypothetical protein
MGIRKGIHGLRVSSLPIDTGEAIGWPTVLTYLVSRYINLAYTEISLNNHV